MKTFLQKKSIVQKTIQVGCSTLMSRLLGIVREYLLVKYLGVGPVSDAFFTAFKIPNSLRKIFAEGALSSAFIPTFLQLIHKDQKEKADRLMSLSFIFFEGIVLILSIFAIWKAEFVLKAIAPGFSAEQITYAVPYLQIMMPFILFISSSALLAGALQSIHHFFIPAIAPILLNIVFIIGLLICIFYQLAVHYFCLFVLLAGALQFVLHLAMYIKLHFSFKMINRDSWQTFKTILRKFIPCTIAMSVMEISLFIDTSFASYLPAGSISLIHYANRFVGIPLGVFAVALSTILLPHFSRITTYAPKRLSFYILESAKLVLWVTTPITLMMGFLGNKIFATLFLSEKFTMAHVQQAHMILIAFLVGLFFFSLNKIIVNVYYARHNTLTPTIIALIVTMMNITLNVFFMRWWKATGLALATSLTVGCLQTILLLIFIPILFKFKIYTASFMRFAFYYSIQLTSVSICIALLYLLSIVIIHTMPLYMAHFLLFGLGFWLWVIPLGAFYMLMLFYTRTIFNIRLHFLE
jgi:putative peptidoglycan lipid II flippase